MLELLHEKPLFIGLALLALLFPLIFLVFPRGGLSPAPAALEPGEGAVVEAALLRLPGF